ncbi:dipeptidase [Plantactinospora sp. GCM10030261]|uniref:dipeptidase n=1 Tax=Plantactinospora sp. GCM10030261 TaxID=3273420 RepID=UPI00360DB711
MHDDLRQTVRQLMPQVRRDLADLVRIPSVSADPAAAGAVRRSAELTARLFDDAGAAEVEVLAGAAGGPPAVLAHYPAPPGRPTVLLYAHHDVQPAGDLAGWTSPPFEPVERDGRMYGRGTADDKAGVAAHLAALRAFRGRPPVGVTVLVEGEEEISSPNLTGFLRRYRDRLGADVVVLADSDNLRAGQPALTTTLRGMVSCVVEVRALRHGAHSGTYGGAAPDALTGLCRLLATLHDDRGEVRIDGLASWTAPTVEYPEDRFRAEAGVLDEARLIGDGSLAERIWARPAATVLAVDAPTVAGATNTLPPVARAKVGLRVAPGDDASSALRALTRHLREHAPWGLRVRVDEGDLVQPHVIEPRGAAFDAARVAYRAGYGADLVEIGGGGSIPIVGEFAAAFPAAAILVTSPGADPDSRPHSTDESLHLGNFERACLAEALLLAELASIDR